MYIHNLSTKNSILNTFISEIRNKTIQKELSKTLNYKSASITSPLGINDTHLIENNIVLCSILRAGVPLHNGLLNYFDTAENAFISAYRHHKHSPESFEIIVEYLACPNLENKTLILADPVLATGQSMVTAFDALKPFGTPKEVHLVSVIGAQSGVDFVSKEFNTDVHLWIAAVDEKLNSKGYIIPGLGDAGDLAFGQKLQQ